MVILFSKPIDIAHSHRVVQVLGMRKPAFLHHSSISHIKWKRNHFATSYVDATRSVNRAVDVSSHRLGWPGEVMVEFWRRTGKDHCRYSCLWTFVYFVNWTTWSPCTESVSTQQLVRLTFAFSLANGPGLPGQYTKTRGFLSYYEVRANDDEP